MAEKSKKIIVGATPVGKSKSRKTTCKQAEIATTNREDPITTDTVTGPRVKRVSKPSAKKREELEEVQEKRKKKSDKVEKVTATKRKKAAETQRAIDAAPDPRPVSNNTNGTQAADQPEDIDQLRHQLAVLQGKVSEFLSVLVAAHAHGVTL